MKTSFFSQRISGGTSGGTGPGGGVDVRQNGSLVVAGATALDFSGLTVSGAGSLAAIAAVPQPPDLSDSVRETTFVPAGNQLAYVLPFDAQDVVDVHINGLSADFTFTAPRTVVLTPLDYLLSSSDRVTVSSLG